MRGKTKTWIITAAALVVVGALIFVGAMTAVGWDFTGLGSSRYETNTYTLSESFSDISAAVNTADVEFLPSEDATCRVVCYERENGSYAATVKDGKLTVSEKRERKWYESLFNFGHDKISVYLPSGAYSALDIEVSTGDVSINGGLTFGDVVISVSTGEVRITDTACQSLKSNGSTGYVYLKNLSVTGKVSVERSTGAITALGLTTREVELEATTGKIELSDSTALEKISLNVNTGKAVVSDVSCSAFKSEGDTGDIILKNTVVDGVLSIERDTGDVKFERSDATEIFVETDTGSVTGTLLTDKIFISRSETGRVDVPSGTVGGRCEITTDTGDIIISIN